MPRRRKAAEGNGSKGTSEAPSLPLEARDLSTADPYDLVSGVIVRPERSRTRQRSRRPSGSPPGRELDPAEQDRSRTKTRRRVDGAGAAAVDAGPVRQRLSRRTISPVHNAERISPVPNAERGPLEGPLDADGRHPSLRKLSQVVLHGDEQSGTSKTSQSVPSSETLTLALTLILTLTLTLTLNLTVTVTVTVTVTLTLTLTVTLTLNPNPNPNPKP